MTDVVDTQTTLERNPSRFSFGEVIPGLELHGRPAPFPVMNERAVRAAAGVMLVAASIAFALAYFSRYFIPIQIVTVFFTIDFALRLFTGLTPFSPTGVLGTLLVRNQKPEWVSAAPKRLAWSMGFVMALLMSFVTNVGIRGPLPLTICVICMILMWMETALGVCVGCKIHSWLVTANLIGAPEHATICTGDSCETVVEA